MLADLLQGLERSHLILVTDEAECSGRHLLLNCIASLGSRCNKIILVCFERHPDFFKDWLAADIQNKVIAVCGRTSATEQTGDGDVLGVATSLAAAQGDGMVGVVIDSLSLSIIQGSASTTCFALHHLAKVSRVLQVVALLHRDVHDQNTISQIEHVASTVIRVESIKGSKYTCAIRHCRNTGKVFRSKEHFSIDDKFCIKDFGSVSQDTSSSCSFSQGDPTAELPFNLSLTDSEKAARSKVRLPYLRDGTGDSEQSNAKIFYQPDESDDFDEEDPDDDLNI